MVIEVPRAERNVDVARFADGLAIVHGLQHAEETLALLDDAGDGIEVTRALVAGKRRPGLEGLARRLHRGIDICGRALRHAGEDLAIGGVRHVEVPFTLREAAADEMSEARLMALQPVEHRAIRFRGRSVIHGVEDF